MRSEVYKGAGGGTWEVYVFYSCRFITDRASVILSLIICFSSSYLGNLNHTVWHTMHIHWYQRLSCLQDDVLCGWCLFCSSRLWVHAVVKYLEAAKELAEVSPPVLCGKNGGIKKTTTIPISHSCPVGCWDCSGDCRFSINLEMQLDTGASDREGETLSRSITSLACHSYKRPDWFI